MAFRPTKSVFSQQIFPIELFNERKSSFVKTDKFVDFENEKKNFLFFQNECSSASISFQNKQNKTIDQNQFQQENFFLDERKTIFFCFINAFLIKRTSRKISSTFCLSKIIFSDFQAPNIHRRTFFLPLISIRNLSQLELSFISNFHLRSFT